MKALGAALAALAMAGCVSVSPTAAPERANVPFLLDSGGIEPVGTGLRIDLGRYRPGVIDTVSRLQSGPPSSFAPCADAGVTAARWEDGLLLVFRDDAFAGWSTPDASRSATGALSAGVTCAG